MTESLKIASVAGPIRGRVRPPGSKSITNRALVCAALADGVSTLSGALDSEDTRVMIESLGRFGIKIEATESGTQLIVHGAAGEIPALEAELECANSGTTIRFLTALATLGHGSFRLDGVPRMRERPIADLLDALNQLARTRQRERRWLPTRRCACQWLAGGNGKCARRHFQSVPQWLTHDRAGCAVHRSQLVIDGPLVSQPYVRMTLEVMKSFGVGVETSESLSEFRIDALNVIEAVKYAIEPDASAASYFWAAAAITGGEVTVEGLSANSLQGDVAFVDCLEKMGCDVRRDAESITVIGRPLTGHRRRYERDQRHRADVSRRRRCLPMGRPRFATWRTSGIRKRIGSRRWPPSCES